MTGIILGIDPGTKTGYAKISYSPEYKILTGGIAKPPEELYELLPGLLEDVELVVVENFQIDPKLARAGKLNWDSMPAPQIIGVVKAECWKMKIPLKLQSRTIKPVGYGWCGLQYVKGKKNVDHLDALVHAVYYAVKHLGMSPPVAMRKTHKDVPSEWLSDLPKFPGFVE